MGSKIKVLVFDVGGVLFLPKKNRGEKHLLSSFGEACLLLKKFGINLTSESSKDLFAIYRKSSRGEISKEKTLHLMSKVLKVSQKRLETSFRKVYRENTLENKKLYHYILRLKKKGYKIGILSTQFSLSKDILIPKKYYEHFNALAISCDDKLKKPDKEAFKHILQKLNAEPEQSIFVDDQQKNLDAAKKLSMKTALFKDNKQFFSHLKKLKVV